MNFRTLGPIGVGPDRLLPSWRQVFRTDLVFSSADEDKAGMIHASTQEANKKGLRVFGLGLVLGRGLGVQHDQIALLLAVGPMQITTLGNEVGGRCCRRWSG